ncbi:hypothetical protein LTR37_010076 [Vermiconidia calcicola]|uniref:Uncharacterized protein n=1 Tax=Vermiconidia calcicola TaxID=1690605 RepID=A0ACC3N604_9PEZI|nr:hypothetical protein LTR37_010076 [Vermiconidia calcicola]
MGVTRATHCGVAEAVLLTTELLEKILLFLPMKDALFAQRVSRKWNAVISESIALQKKLFLLPEKTTNRVRFEFEHGDRNCRITKVDPNTAVDNRGVRDTANHLVVRRVTDVAIFNPLLLHDPFGLHPISRRTRLGYPAGAHFGLPPVELPRQASFYKMLLTQPPLRKATAYHVNHIHRRCENQHRGDKVENEAGLTALDLVTSGRLVEQHLQNYHGDARARLRTSALITKQELISEADWARMEVSEGKVIPLRIEDALCRADVDPEHERMSSSVMPSGYNRYWFR